MTAGDRLRRLPLTALLALAACASAPTGPTVPVLPGTGKSLEQFHADDVACQQFAMTQTMGVSKAATASSYAMQRSYDLGYIQCMYSKGHRVPVLGPMAVQPARAPGQLQPPAVPSSPAPSGTPR